MSNDINRVRFSNGNTYFDIPGPSNPVKDAIWIGVTAVVGVASIIISKNFGQSIRNR